MYTVNEITIDGDVLTANVTYTFDKTSVICNVPVKFPKDKETVIAAIEAREAAEFTKWDAAPILTALKTDLDATVVGKTQTTVK